MELETVKKVIARLQQRDNESQGTGLRCRGSVIVSEVFAETV